MSSIFDMSMAIVLATVVMSLVITLLVIGVIVYAIRRATPSPQARAIAELKRRLADGEITPVEYEVRMRALIQGD